MGSKCCSEQEELNPLSKKLIRATFSNTGKLSFASIKMYDIESNEENTVNVKISFIKSLESFSQISVGNWLFMLGVQGDFDTGSTFIKYDITSPVKSFSILVNSVYLHYRASLVTFKRDYLLAIGGKESLKCEIFHKNTNKWRILPDLTEERYGASLLSDDKNDSVYCFGGYDTESKKYCKDLIKLNLKTGLNWESIQIKNNAYLMERSFSSLIKTSNKEIVYIFGGKKGNKECSDEIIEFDLIGKSASLLLFGLNSHSKFDVNSVGEHEGNFFLIDDDSKVHKVSRREAFSDIMQPTQISSGSNNQKEEDLGKTPRKSVLLGENSISDIKV